MSLLESGAFVRCTEATINNNKNNNSSKSKPAQLKTQQDFLEIVFTVGCDFSLLLSVHSRYLGDGGLRRVHRPWRRLRLRHGYEARLLPHRQQPVRVRNIVGALPESSVGTKQDRYFRQRFCFDDDVYGFHARFIETT